MAKSVATERKGLLASVARELFPGYFAFVMATGILATAATLTGLPVMPQLLFGLACAGYVWLLFLTAMRIGHYRTEFVSDFRLFPRAPGFFTVVAATSVLAAGLIRLFKAWDLAFGLWLVALAVWLVLIYAFALMVITTEQKPPIEKAVNGSWLILVVATQSLSIVGSLLSAHVAQEWVFVLAAGLFMLGCALYLLLISLVTMRLLFRLVEAADLTPPYWVLMGSAAISTLAGVELDRHSSAWTLQVNALPVLQGFTLFFWIAATGWIPLLLLLGYWRHIVKRHTFGYEPQLWSVVFPLGMYSVATYSLAADFKLPFLRLLGPAFAYVAMGAWLLTFAGLAANVVRGLRPRPSANSAVL